MQTVEGMDIASEGKERSRRERVAAASGAYVQSRRFLILSSLLLAVIVVANVAGGQSTRSEGEAGSLDMSVGYPEPGVAVSPPMYGRGGWSDGGYGDGSMVASTSYLTMSVEDSEGKLDVVTRLVGDAGGFVISSSLDRYDRAAPPVVYLTARVPAGELDGFIRDVAGLGVVLSRSTSSSDVSGAFVDVSTQLELLRVQAADLVALLESSAAARQPGELVELVQNLAQVRSEIVRLEAEVASIERQVAFALVSVTLQGSEILLVDSGTWSVSSEFRSALAQLSGAFRSVTSLAIRTLVFTVPLLVLVVPVWLMRRRRSRAVRRAGDREPSEF
jgi:hypothetical protein